MPQEDTRELGASPPDFVIQERPKRKRKRKEKHRIKSMKDGMIKQLKFVTKCVAFSMGLGNVWRFPYLSYDNGGGAFLVPYMLILLLAGIPLLAAEMIIGQYSGLGPGQIFRHMCPIFQGLGYAMMLVSVLTAVFYNMVFAWTLFYLYISIKEITPWKGCTNEWNDETCFDNEVAAKCRAENKSYFKAGCILTEDMCQMLGKMECRYAGMHARNATHCYLDEEDNSTDLLVPELFNYTLSSEQYLKGHVLKISEGPLIFGTPDPTLLFWLCVSWSLCFVKMITRFHNNKYMMFVTTFFPYLMFVVMFFRTVTLKGAIYGLKFYMVPQFKYMINPDMWGNAAAQICFSLGPGFGFVISIASFWKFDNDIIRNAFIIGFMDTGSSVLGGIVIFCFLGYLVSSTHIPMEKIVSEGTWLAFTALPEAILEFDLPQVWSVILWVFMIVSLGVDLQFDAMESLLTSLIDEYPHLRDRKTLIVLICCIAFCVMGILFTGPNGAFLFRMCDEYLTGWILVFLALIENIVVFRIYNRSRGKGRQRFYEDYYEMFGSEPTPYWRSCWKIFSPITLVLVLLFSWFWDEPPPFGPYEWEPMPIRIGKCMAASPIFVVIGFAIYRIVMKYKHGETWKSLIMPTEHWISARERGIKEDIFPDMGL